VFKNETGKPIHVSADRSRVLAEGDTEPGILLVGVDGEIALEEAERLGLTKAAKAAQSKAVEKPPATKGSAEGPAASSARR
jgi:hypothetical protein